MKVLGLFSAMNHDLNPGGIQLTADLAWTAIQSSSQVQSNYCFQYQAGAAQGKASQQTRSHTLTYSKKAAIVAALRRSWSFDAVLVWHVGLLKLLPFFRLQHTKVILFLHGIEVWRSLDPVTRLLLRRTDLFLSNTNYTWFRCCQTHPFLSSFPQRTVHLGLDTALEETVLRPPSNPSSAIMVGRVALGEDYKGHREVILAWPRVREHIPDAELWIAGDGDLRLALEGMAGNGVQFFGRVSETEKLNLISRSRALLMPSQGEGFGLVYLEAMAQGRPCLVSDCDAGREVVNPPEAGLAVDPKNSDALTDAIVRLLTPGSEWQAWSRQSRQHYQQKFTATHFQQRLLAAMGITHG